MFASLKDSGNLTPEPGSRNLSTLSDWKTIMPPPRLARLPVPLALWAAATLTAGFPLVSTLQAQDTTGAVLRGRAIDDETGEPVGSLIIRIAGIPVVNGDSLGRFVVTNLPLGELQVTVQGLGYRPLRVKIRVDSDTDVIERRFAMEFDGQNLPDVVVTARAQRLVPRYVDFERRRERGLGAYFRWDEIKNRGFNRVGDALRTVRGVRIVCDQRSFECNAVMARSRGCSPTWYIDGVRVGSFHENTSIRDLYGIEIYRGAGEIPAEFMGSDAACGVIVLWTKSRPFRGRP